MKIAIIGCGRVGGSIYLVNRVARRRRKSFKDYIEASQQGEDFGS